MGDSPASARQARSVGPRVAKQPVGGHRDPMSPFARKSLASPRLELELERDRGKADESCLIERMNDRIQDLMQR